jgi:hypothetical protein
MDFGVARLWQHDTMGVRGRLGVMKTSGVQATAGSGYTEMADSSLVWGHQWNAEVAQELSAGVLIMRNDQASLMPTASASVTWQRPGSTLTGRLAQTAQSSVMVGTSYQRRVATLAVVLPVNRLETMRLVASANLERDTPVGASAGSSGSINVFNAQAGLGWQPGDTFSYSLAYTFRDQFAADAGGNPSAFSSFRQQTIMFTVSAGYAGIF